MAATTPAAIDERRQPPVSQPDPSPRTPSRLLFRQPVTEDGFLDAGWWPRSRDLAAELPALLDVLWVAGRDVMRVSYALDFWGLAPRRLNIDGRIVRLGGFHTQIPGLLTLLDAWGHDRVNILVIPPDTDSAVANRALILVTGEPSRDYPDQVLRRAREQTAPGSVDDGQHVGAAGRTQAWEDGDLPTPWDDTPRAR